MYQMAQKSADIMNVKNVATVFCRFLSLQTMNTIPCPDCGMDIDYEIGPDETLEAAEDTAVLVEKITGEEEVEKMDSLLSLAITGGDYNWI